MELAARNSRRRLPAGRGPAPQPSATAPPAPGLAPHSTAPRPAAARGPRTPPRCDRGERVARGRRTVPRSPPPPHRSRCCSAPPPRSAAALRSPGSFPAPSARSLERPGSAAHGWPSASERAGDAGVGPPGRRHLCFPSGFDSGPEVSCLLWKSKGLRRKPVHISEVR